MIIQPLYMRTGEIVNPPGEYIPRTREAVEFLIREDMITAVCTKWRYPGMPPASRWNNYDPLSSSMVSVYKGEVEKDYYINSNINFMHFNREATPLEIYETAPYDISQRRYPISRKRINSSFTDEFLIDTQYNIPVLFFGGRDDNHYYGKINHKRSYSGTGIGMPRQNSFMTEYGDDQSEHILTTLYGYTFDSYIADYKVENQINWASGLEGPSAYISGETVFINPQLEPLGPIYPSSAMLFDGDASKYSVVMRESPRELPEDPNPHITTHYRVTFDCSSTLKVSHPNQHVATKLNALGVPTEFKWYNRLEPSGIVAIKSIGVPTTSIILGSKDGTGHGKYLEEFNMEYGGVGPDCFNANCIRIKDIVFEKYYPTSYFYRNGSYLNGVDGQTMGSLYKGCLLLESVPAMNFDLIDYDGFFYNCNKLKSIGSNGLSGLYQNAMSMDGFLYGLNSYDTETVISAPKLTSFYNNSYCKKLPKLIINQSNFRSLSNPSQPWRIVFEMLGSEGMTLDSMCETLEAIYNYEVVVNGGRLDRLQFRFSNNLLVSSSSARSISISNLIASVGGNVLIANI